MSRAFIDVNWTILGTGLSLGKSARVPGAGGEEDPKPARLPRWQHRRCRVNINIRWAAVQSLALGLLPVPHALARILILWRVHPGRLNAVVTAAGLAPRRPNCTLFLHPLHLPFRWKVRCLLVS